MRGLASLGYYCICVNYLSRDVEMNTMMKLMSFILTLTVLTILTSTFLPADAVAAANGDEKIHALVERIKGEVENIRGLKFTHDIGSRIVSNAELLDFIKGEVDEQVPEEKEKAINLIYHQLGLIPEDKGFIETFQALMTDQAGGLYNPDDNELYVVVENLPGVNASGEADSGLMSMLGIDPMLMLETVLAHELTHALEDQHFAFNDAFEEIQKESSSDKEFALQSLVEGSATRLMMDHATGGIPLNEFQRTLNRVLTDLVTELSVNAPTYFKRSLTTPYIYGEKFVTYLLTQNGGWNAINAAYNDPPQSMEQIIHPEKYLKNRDYPSDVELTDFLPVLGDGYEELMYETFGEFVTDILFDTRLKREDFDAAPQGWDGDRLVGYVGPDGEVTIIWHTVWDTDADASEFAYTLNDYLFAREGWLEPVDLQALGLELPELQIGPDGREYSIVIYWNEVIFVDNAPSGMGNDLMTEALSYDSVKFL